MNQKSTLFSRVCFDFLTDIDIESLKIVNFALMLFRQAIGSDLDSDRHCYFCMGSWYIFDKRSLKFARKLKFIRTKIDQLTL